jgi:hypothetical protein
MPFPGRQRYAVLEKLEVIERKPRAEVFADAGTSLLMPPLRSSDQRVR